MVPLRVVACLLILFEINTQVVQIIPVPDYNFAGAPLPVHVNGSTRTIQPPFPIRFQNESYSLVYVNTNGYITFTGPVSDFSLPEFVYAPKILIGPNSYSLTSLTAVATADNLTLRYKGVDSDFDSSLEGSELVTSAELQWSITFYNSLEQRYVVSVQSGNYSIRVCSSLNCLLRIPTVPTQGYEFIVCGKGKSLDAATTSCQASNLPNCAKYMGSVCLQCRNECKFDATGNCVQCSDNFTMFNGSCKQKSARCLVPNHQNPGICDQCQEHFTTRYCTACSQGSFRSGYQCPACGFANCAQCTFFACRKCVEGSRMDLGQCLTYEEYRNRILAICLGVLGGVSVLFSLLFVCAVGRDRACRKLKLCFCCRCCIRGTDIVKGTLTQKEADDKISHKQLEDMTGMTTSQICPICLNGRAEVMTDCKHYFHRDCIEKALGSDRICPSCSHPQPQIFSQCTLCREFVVSQVGDQKCGICVRQRCATEDNITQNNI